MPTVEFVEPVEALRGLRPMERPSSGAVSARLVNGLRGCYGGILMVGVLTSLAGMKLISPWSVAAGVAPVQRGPMRERGAFSGRRYGRSGPVADNPAGIGSRRRQLQRSEGITARRSRTTGIEEDRDGRTSRTARAGRRGRREGEEQHEAGEHAEGHHHHGEEILHKIEHGWQHLEDLTGGRAHIELAGEDQESNFEHIERHENAEHH